MKTKFKINDKDFQTIKDINKEGNDSVMYLGGGIQLGSGRYGAFMSKEEKINAFWDSLAKREKFDTKTIEPINNREFYAETTEEKACLIQDDTEINQLRHHKATTVGLWATDQPDKLSEEEKKRCSLFEIT